MYVTHSTVHTAYADDRILMKILLVAQIYNTVVYG